MQIIVTVNIFWVLNAIVITNHNFPPCSWKIRDKMMKRIRKSILSANLPPYVVEGEMELL